MITHPRKGAALIEILVAMMIMTIGVVMVASIFPVAVKRSIQSNQLTQGRLMKEQAEQLLHIVTGLLPDHTTFAAVTVGTTKSEPAASVGTKRLRIVDPVAYWHMQGVENINVYRIFGSNNGNADSRGIIRVNGNSPGVSWTTAQEVMFSRDSWQTNWNEAPVSNDSTSITFPSEASSVLDDLKNRILSAGTTVAPYKFKVSGRMEIFSSDYKEVQVRNFTAANIDTTNNTINFTSNLPNNNKYYSNLVPNVRLQILDQRMSWFLTTRMTLTDKGTDNTSGTADDIYKYDRSYIVIFAHRPITALPEQIHTATTTLDNSSISITWAGERPKVTAGSHIMDINNGIWYRIQSVESISDTKASVTLDRRVVETFTNMVIPEGIVEVYPVEI